MSGLELKYLETFKVIAQEGSFTAAAEKLNYTQSAITFQIDRLERELSVKLFEKVGRKMVLTAAGKALVPCVDEVFGAVERLRYVERDISECEGEIHIGVAETYLCYRLPKALKAFVEAAPRAKLFINSMNCYEIRNKLVSGELDMGIFYEDIGGIGTSLNVNKIQSCPIALVAAPATAERFSDFTTRNQRHSIPLIINEPNCIFRQIFEKYLNENGIILDHTIELGSIATIKNLVQSGVGVTFLPKFTVEEELKSGSLVEIKTNVEHGELTVVCAYHKNKWLSPLMKRFAECVENI